ncbi:MAG: hypothetical protein J0I79_27940 [Mesorhizobium sp.]|uniref:hypothetical protein n=1 Tax=Mesorhizobium sp. TaxID=1871066 RepID=UPI001AC87B74|nr:hypothetical protein [Mesorhizobium sp.]MBN9221794.1 hypothetical protein [Mesorhizobium sp.]
MSYLYSFSPFPRRLPNAPFLDEGLNPDSSNARTDPAAVGLMITIAALQQRHESRGAHFWTDFPYQATIARRSEITLDAAIVAVWELASSPALEGVI